MAGPMGRRTTGEGGHWWAEGGHGGCRRIRAVMLREQRLSLLEAVPIAGARYGLGGSVEQSGVDPCGPAAAMPRVGPVRTGDRGFALPWRRKQP